MIVRPTSNLTRHVLYVCNQVRFASTATTSTRTTKLINSQKDDQNHGQRIYVYRQFQTNQIVYSMGKSMKNKASLQQLPYNGKKTVPAAIRKDLWVIMAVISFPQGSAAAGLSTFQKLREYRRLHELSWDESIRKDEDGKVRTRQAIGRKLCDQQANSVADVAAVLKMLGTPQGKKIGLTALKPAEEGAASVPQVEIMWSNLKDALYALSWSKNVIHSKLDWEAHEKEVAAEGREKRQLEDLARSQQRKKEKALKAEAERQRAKAAEELKSEQEISGTWSNEISREKRMEL